MLAKGSHYSRHAGGGSVSSLREGRVGIQFKWERPFRSGSSLASHCQRVSFFVCSSVRFADFSTRDAEKGESLSRAEP